MSQRFRILARIVAAPLLASTVFATPATAQRNDDGTGGFRFWSDPQGEFFFHGTVGVPVGEFNRHVDIAGGAGLGGTLFLSRDRMVALRAEGNFLIYGSEGYDAPLSTTIPIDVRVRTTNSILSAGMGPQIYFLDRALRPYIFGTFGFSYFVTGTSVRGHGADSPIASTIDFDDFVMALKAGGGVSARVTRGGVPVSLDVSASYQRNGLVEYLIAADTGHEHERSDWQRWHWDKRHHRGRGDGHPAGDPILSQANLVTYRIGVSLGVG